MIRAAPENSLADAIAEERGLILFMTGAGISLASGIPTFRGDDPGAIWARERMELATVEHFSRDPAATWRWYRERFAAAQSATANPAHTALAALERWQRGRGGQYVLVTQNIDTLHEQAGSLELVKVHGSADKVRCSRERCSSGETTVIPLSDLDFTAFDDDPREAHVPRCAACGGLMRPHILWFDELYVSHPDYRWSTVAEVCAQMRLVVAVGTSFSVGVTDFVQDAAVRRGIDVFVVDPAEPAAGVGAGVVYVRAKAEDLLPRVMARLESGATSTG